MCVLASVGCQKDNHDDSSKVHGKVQRHQEHVTIKGIALLSGKPVAHGRILQVQDHGSEQEQMIAQTVTDSSGVFSLETRLAFFTVDSQQVIEAADERKEDLAFVNLCVELINDMAEIKGLVWFEKVPLPSGPLHEIDLGSIEFDVLDVADQSDTSDNWVLEAQGNQEHVTIRGIALFSGKPVHRGKILHIQDYGSEWEEVVAQTVTDSDGHFKLATGLGFSLTVDVPRGMEVGTAAKKGQAIADSFHLKLKHDKAEIVRVREFLRVPLSPGPSCEIDLGRIDFDFPNALNAVEQK